MFNQNNFLFQFVEVFFLLMIEEARIVFLWSTVGCFVSFI